MIDQDMRDIVASSGLCFVATVNDDGTPNLSPKASLAVYDDQHLVFANIASPATVANLRSRPALVINAVDVLARRGYKFSGSADLMSPGTSEYNFVAEPLWAAQGDQYPVHEIVKVRVHAVEQVRSPAYTYGGPDLTEATIREQFAKKYGLG